MNKQSFQLYPRIILCQREQFKSSQGIHLLQPSIRNVEDAIESALKDNFEVIYCHYEFGSDTSRLDIEVAMLAFFFRLVQRDGVQVDAADREEK